MTNSNTILEKGFIISSSLYDNIKRLVMIILPLSSIVYYAIGSYMGWLNIAQVLGIIACIIVFLGIVLNISTKAYSRSDVRFDGSVDIYTTDADVKVYSLTLNSDPEDLDDQQTISFKVNRG